MVTHGHNASMSGTIPSALTQRVTALAALCQSVYLVDAIARKGNADEADMHACSVSILASVAGHTSIADIYGGIHHLQTGLRTAISLLKGEAIPQAKSLMTYAAGIMTIERKLAKNAKMRTHLAEGMQRIATQAQYFGSTAHPNITAAIAGLYAETISTMKPRIIVRGKPEFLTQKTNTDKVRTLLIAALRATHLWRKHGGSHFKLLLGRKKLLREAERLLKEASIA